MKLSASAAVLAAIVAFAAPASAQCFASGASGLPNGEPISLVMKYAWKLSDVKPTALKTALEKLPTVERTAFDEKNPFQILVKFKGRCDQVLSLETAAREAGVPAYVVNHAHVSVMLKPQAGGNVKSAIEALSKIAGALYAKPSGAAGLELHANLVELNMTEIKLTSEFHKCDVTVNQTYEFLRYKLVDGDASKFQTVLNGMKGVMVIRPEENQVVGLWINKAVVKKEQIEKLDGFKVEKAEPQ